MSLMIGFRGHQVDQTLRTWLKRPEVASVIFFSRNFVDRNQLSELVREIRELRPDVALAVDQEGGPVQRFRAGFSALPPLQALGALYQSDARAGIKATRLHAALMVSEMLEAGFDLSLAPVVDLARGNRAIGTRAFAAEPAANALLSAVYVRQMQDSGMSATLKHFPGHGSVLEDSHVEVPRDQRSFPELLRADLLPFASGVRAGAKAVMMAHVHYPRIDAELAGYSRFWIAEVLRAGLGFRGVVMGDDVSMQAGASAGSIRERVERHYLAGCDLVLACQPEAVDEALSACSVALSSAMRRALRAPEAGHQGPAIRARIRSLEQQLQRLLEKG
jgi:beta-N-acetylhexosaminidase